MRFGRAGIDDGARLWALRLEMLADAPLAFQDTLDAAVGRGLGDYLARVAYWADDPDQVILVAEERGRLVGHLRAFAEHGRTGLVQVYVAPDWRGRGVLAGLVDAAAGWSRGADRPELLLSVMADNARAVRAYSKLGFVATGVRYPNPNMPVFAEVEMVRAA
jgi:GNAT superfamily N-acetyltransferase